MTTFKIYTEEQITEELFQQFITLEHHTWPRDDDSYLSESYLREVFGDGFGLFLAVDAHTGELAGYLNFMIASKTSMQTYLETKDFMALYRATAEEESMLYIYTANLWEAYRGTSCMKALGKAMAKKLDDLDELNRLPKHVISEAVSPAGAKTITNHFRMTPMTDVDEMGLGHYENHDGLAQYRMQMKKF